MFGFVYTYFFTTLHQIGFVYFLHKMCISWKMHLAQGLNTLWMWCAIKINRESNSKMICNSISVINFIPVVGNPVTKKNHFYNVCLKYTMLQRNVQNVKLRLDFIEIWSYYRLRHSDFTWNQILVNSNGPKMSFLAILEVLNCGF